ncbi:hypothetical protein PCASD_25666 [Puccinia coronata f. sp. avenae]|uniref:Uncharacterized protein n=1 Tax=Puccinia coronata f. sp. avenae TaxID=200324 RepID=A0A2N5RXF3_9BASI|nr:hypothetical protein PCASD_25666 [Puccinia coronata f. sp. avenae]
MVNQFSARFPVVSLLFHGSIPQRNTRETKPYHEDPIPSARSPACLASHLRPYHPSSNASDTHRLPNEETHPSKPPSSRSNQTTPSSSSALSPKKLAKTKISTKIIRGILDSAVKKQVSVSSSSSIPNSHRHIWPQNLRVEDDWKGRGKWGEVRPDHLEWLGVPKKHKDLMLSLRAER